MRRIFDSVHGFIHLDETETALVDSRPFQRLRYIRQLGVSHMVFPGAAHTRFEHSLGVMEVASTIYERIKEDAPEHVDTEYWGRVIRLAALAHDLGHLPFSHVAEKTLLPDSSHEVWSERFIRSDELAPIFNEFSIDDIVKVALGPEKVNLPFTPWESLVSQVITGDFFGADRIDYLLRDTQCTGVSYGLFDYEQLLEMLRILPDGDGMAIGVEEDGLESCEALLVARHFMRQRVYRYRAVKAYAFHMARFMGANYQGTLIDLQSYLALTDNEVISLVHQAAKDPLAPGHEDAISLLDRTKLYKVFEVERGESKPDNIPDDKCIFEEDDWATWSPELPFPVLTLNGKIKSANDLARISIKKRSLKWAYLHPNYSSVFLTQ